MEGVIDLKPRVLQRLRQIDTFPATGKVSQVVGIVMEGLSTVSAVGEICEVRSTSDQDVRILAEVVGFRGDRVLLMPLGDLAGIGPHSAIIPQASQSTCIVGDDLLGRVIDGMGNPLDGKGPIRSRTVRPLHAPPANPLARNRITQPLDLGIRSINGLLTCGRGQRLGIFSGSGVGKSVLMGMMARYTEADVSVIALIGERGREVKEFIESDLTEVGLRRSVVVVSTSDQPPLVRRRGAFLAMTIAEYFRDQSAHVLFMMDSLTRLAHAQREIGLAVGEPPTTKGYTPSVFAMLPKFLERAGTAGNCGTITGIFTVLVEGDDMNDPIPDAARAILDGHVYLSRELASQSQYPAVDVLGSTSRVMISIVDSKHMAAARKLAEVMSTYKKVEDMINIGAYKVGTNKKIDHAIAKWDAIGAYFKQGINEKVDLKESVRALQRLVA